jgi:repressor LexA
MHITQQNLLKLIKEKNLSRCTLREIGHLINEKYPQKIKHHLIQLNKKGLINVDFDKKTFEIAQQKNNKDADFINIPIVGMANCGPATLFAEENYTGQLKVTKQILNKNKKKLYVLKAIGNSLNRANINGESVDDGDYLIVDEEAKDPLNGQYIVSVIDGCANIKKFIKDKEKKRIVLISESTTDYPPIYIHPDEKPDYLICGTVIQVLKTPKNHLYTKFNI